MSIRKGDTLIAGGSKDTHFMREPVWDHAVVITYTQLAAGYSAPVDGIIVGYFLSVTSANLTVNDVPVAHCVQANNNYVSYGNVQVVVSAGDIVKSSSNFRDACVIKFVPFEDSTVDNITVITPKYIYQWFDITSDWSLSYVQSGTPTIEKVLWRPSTRELKVILDATNIGVAAGATWSITARYDGTDRDIINMKNHPFEHAASIMPANPAGIYMFRVVQCCISFGDTIPEFYATIRNIDSNVASLKHIIYHITL